MRIGKIAHLAQEYPQVYASSLTMADERFDTRNNAHESQAESGDENLTRYFQIVLDIMRETEQQEKRN